jgi:predicted transcriptional regulator
LGAIKLKSITEPLSEKVLNSLIQEKFSVQEFRSDFCFQLMALKHINLLIKISYNIDAIRDYILNQLRLISIVYPSFPLIIGEKNKHAPLEDDNIYLRRDIYAMNLNTFRKMLSRSAFSYIYAQRGRYVVEIDGDKLRETREQKNMKVSELAELLGVSTKAIEQYEKNQVNVKLEIADKMERIFQTDLRRKVEILGDMMEKLVGLTISIDELNSLSKTAPEDKKIDKNLDSMVKHISEVIEDIGYQMLNLYNSPFDVLMYNTDPKKESNRFYHFPGKMVPEWDHLENHLNESAIFIKSYLEKGAMIFDDTITPEIPDIIVEKKIPYLRVDELKYLNDPEQIRKILLKRKI